MNEMKACCRCKKKLSVSKFSIQSRANDGLCPRCKKCDRKRKQERYQRNKEKEIKRAREYRQEHKEEINARLQKQRQPRRAEINKMRKQNFETSFITRAGEWKRRAAQRNIKWNKNLTANFLKDLFEKQGKKCALTSMPLSLKVNHNHDKYKSISLDRINNNRRYARNNVQFVNTWANRAKTNLNTENFFSYIKATYKTFSQKLGIK